MDSARARTKSRGEKGWNFRASAQVAALQVGQGAGQAAGRAGNAGHGPQRAEDQRLGRGDPVESQKGQQQAPGQQGQGQQPRPIKTVPALSYKAC